MKGTDELISTLNTLRESLDLPPSVGTAGDTIWETGYVAAILDTMRGLLIRLNEKQTELSRGNSQE